jgi:hypothetical protein
VFAFFVILRQLVEHGMAAGGVLSLEMLPLSFVLPWRSGGGAVVSV